MRYRASIVLDVDIPDPAMLRTFAHAELQEMAASDPLVREQLGPDATGREIADYYAKDPETLAAVVLRTMLSRAFEPVMEVSGVSVVLEAS